MMGVKAMLARSDCLHPGFSAILQGRSISSLCKKKKERKKKEKKLLMLNLVFSPIIFPLSMFLGS